MGVGGLSWGVGGVGGLSIGLFHRSGVLVTVARTLSTFQTKDTRLGFEPRFDPFHRGSLEFLRTERERR